jgi:hypothetical protein
LRGLPGSQGSGSVTPRIISPGDVRSYRRPCARAVVMERVCASPLPRRSITRSPFDPQDQTTGSADERALLCGRRVMDIDRMITRPDRLSRLGALALPLTTMLVGCSTAGHSISPLPPASTAPVPLVSAYLSAAKTATVPSRGASQTNTLGPGARTRDSWTTDPSGSRRFSLQQLRELTSSACPSR